MSNFLIFASSNYGGMYYTNDGTNLVHLTHFVLNGLIFIDNGRIWMAISTYQWNMDPHESGQTYVRKNI